MRDLSKIVQKHKQLVDKENNSSGDWKEKWLQIKDGKNQIRVLPGKTEEDMVFSETSIHRVYLDSDDSKKQTALHCRKIHGKSCPLCELNAALWREYNEDNSNESARALARKVKASPRYYLNVVDLGDDNKVKVFSLGGKLFNQIFGEIIDAAKDVDSVGEAQEPIDLLSLTEGADFIVDRDNSGEWPNYAKSKFRRKQSKVTAVDPLENLHNLEELVKIEPYDVMRTAALTVAPSMSHLFDGIDTDNMDEVDNSATSEEYSEQLKA